MSKIFVLGFMLLSIFYVEQSAYSADSADAGKTDPKNTPAAYATNSNDNYIGDCFHVYLKTKTPDDKILNPGWYLTLAQDKEKLSMVKVQSNGIYCSPKKADVGEGGYPIEVQVNVHDLDGRAKRTGWVYGALVLPFKYHLEDKSFSGETTIGPYLGRRSTLGSSSFIWAVTAGLTPLSVESTDAGGNQKSTQLSAFTYAAGLMFEINNGASPFRVGLFYGTDVVSSDSVVTYKHDRQNWLAFQLGWDFVAK
jgi:hypothetical protein